MNLVQWLNCKRGKHARSRGHARQDGNSFRSHCRGCGAAMVRTPQGWIVDSGTDASLSDA